ncbi:hypothetical protein GALMADRAFT_240567 [Galerina marginata CBS 339.88]|uniref:Uncharacterized protein n=1 Tax=Galerina marginata (strain CBS 339.88) TaxID=685588 RepID=A0A067TQ96_GALM3|nr:hypothetical protein GALMADRAFT_240567 [Galerina marginata CBS 339.88]
MMKFAILNSFLVSVVLLSVGVQAAGPVTLYRAGVDGDSPSEPSETILSLVAVGVGSDGGTTYSEVEVNSGLVTLSLPTGTPVFTTFSATATVTDLFVEHASWIYRSYADSSKKFNGFEQNCSFVDASKQSANCVEIFRLVVGGTTTQATTQTVTETVKPWYTYTGPQPTSSGLTRYASSLWLPVSAFGIVLASVYCQ